MISKIYCDECHCRINDSYDEDRILYILELPSDTLFFCSETCRDNFIEEYTREVCLKPNGSIEEE